MPALHDGRYKRAMLEAERAILRGALAETGGDLKHAAKLLGIARRTMYQRLEACGIDLDLIRLELEASGQT